MTRRVFAGGDVLVDGVLTRADVVVDDGRIVALVADGTDGMGDDSERAGPHDDPTGAEIVDCAGAIVAAGFIDLQCNGAGGIDITTRPDGIEEVARVLPRFGVTAFLPTVVTSPAATRHAAIRAMQELRSSTEPTAGAVPLGLHFEGPCISMDHLGAHARRHVTVPTDTELDEWVDSGVVALATLAPEVNGAAEMASHLARGGVVVSAGHTAMTPDDLRRARDGGVTYVTHLFNAMRPFSHRAPGPIGATLADDVIVAGLICDGVHVDPVAVRMAWNTLGPGRCSLVSDASAPLGEPFGTFDLGGLEVVHDETGVRTRDGVLAGSALGLDRAVRNLVGFTGCSLAEAVATVTTTPANVLGLTDRGRIRVGNHADLTVLEPDGHLRATVIGGSVAWSR